MKLALPLTFLFFAQILAAQVAFVDVENATELRKSNDIVVVLAAELPKTAKKLAKKKGADYPAIYHQMVADYNDELRNAFAAEWRVSKVSFMTRAELKQHISEGKSPNCWFIATSFADEMLAEAALQTAKSKATAYDQTAFLASRDEQSSLDVLSAAQFEQYFTPKSDWDLQQQKKMEVDKQLGKPAQPGDYLRHRRLAFAGFYLSQHALMTRGDLRFGIRNLLQDFEKVAANPKKAVVNQPPALKTGALAKKTLLVGRDLVVYPNGKEALAEADIKKQYPHAVKVVGQAEIEMALAKKTPDVAVIIPAVRWSPTGYPELQVFWVVDAADGGISILSFADTGSGSNAMTSGNFEKSAELKLKHFAEIAERGAE